MWRAPGKEGGDMKRAAMAVRGTLVLMLAATGAPHAARAAENKACALLTPAELQEAVTARSQKDMVPIEKLRPLAEKIAAWL
jgi:hypothetical protein